jgi:FMN phosphatase YigB (HAD superfamily)
MADWPCVDAAASIHEILAALHPFHRIIDRSNATNLDAAQVRSALRRVKIERDINAVFIFHELRAKKPEIAFYRSVERKLNLLAQYLLLIGVMED